MLGRRWQRATRVAGVVHVMAHVGHAQARRQHRLVRAQDDPEAPGIGHRHEACGDQQAQQQQRQDEGE